jgi:hypothetical protein
MPKGLKQDRDGANYFGGAKWIVNRADEDGTPFVSNKKDTKNNAYSNVSLFSILRFIKSIIN